MEVTALTAILNVSCFLLHVITVKLFVYGIYVCTILFKFCKWEVELNHILFVDAEYVHSKTLIPSLVYLYQFIISKLYGIGKHYTLVPAKLCYHVILYFHSVVSS